MSLNIQTHDLHRAKSQPHPISAVLGCVWGGRRKMLLRQGFQALAFCRSEISLEKETVLEEGAGFTWKKALLICKATSTLWARHCALRTERWLKTKCPWGRFWSVKDGLLRGLTTKSNSSEMRLRMLKCWPLPKPRRQRTTGTSRIATFM